MKLNVLLFAQAQQLAGAEKIEVELKSGSTVGDLRQAIETSSPELAAILKRSSIALDQEYAVDADVVKADAEVALIPPVSGG